MPDSRGAGLHEAFQIWSVRLYICPSVRLHFNLCFILHRQFTLDPNILTFSGPPIKLLVGGLIRGAPDPPNPPYRGREEGAKISFWGLWLMDHSNPNRIKYSCEALDLKYILSNSKGGPLTSWPFTDWNIIHGAVQGAGKGLFPSPTSAARWWHKRSLLVSYSVSVVVTQ